MRLLASLRSSAAAFGRELLVYNLVLQDSRVLKPAKWLIGMAIAYAVSTIGVIPDFIPVIGYVDDVLIVPALLLMARQMIPRNVIDDCRTRAHETP
jgi:uncharacterized membrane protein YkvA (DUF1232 family)